MAFATSNIQSECDGSMWALTGSWSGNTADTTTGSIVVGGAKVSSVYICDNSPNNNTKNPMSFSVSTNTSTGLSTISWNYQEDVSSGVFKIVYR